MSARCAVVLLLSCPLAAQAVLRVGPGGFAQIQDAIVRAAPNDVIEVAAGTYSAFTLDKPLTITALPSPPGQIVQVINPSFLGAAAVVFRPPAGTRAFVTNLHFRNLWPIGFPLHTRVERGTVCFEECTFEGASDATEPGLRVQSAEVQLRRCLLQGGRSAAGAQAALSAGNSAVFAVDCFVRGGDIGFKTGTNGGNGIFAHDTLLHLVRTDVVAGNGDGIACVSGWAAGHGVLVQGASTAWIADCTLRGGNGSCQSGGDALRNLSTTPVQLARTALTPGTGTPPGVASFGPTAPAPLLGLSGGTVGLARGQPWLANYRTEPFWPIAVMLATDVLVQSSPMVAERLLLPLPNSTTFALLLADANGSATLQTTVPPLAILQHRRAYLQAFSGLALPARTQPALGGVIR